MNAREASSMVDAVRKHGVFLMEAMWTRFLPAVREVKRIIEDGAIGTPRSFLASFGFRAAYNPQGRLFDPALGGGALLDLGIYPVSFAAHMLGSIQTALGIADYAPSGVDHNFSASLLHADGGISAVHGATSINTLGTGFVYGESGMIEIHGAFFHPHSFTLRRDGKQEVRIERPYQDPGYQYEIDAVGEALSRGELEHPLMPLDESVQIMNTLDQIRANWKLPYD
jgi:predicted dehydrogenase